MVEQFSVKFRATAEEEIYRFTFMLLQDAVQVRLGNTYALHNTDLIFHCVLER